MWNVFNRPKKKLRTTKKSENWKRLWNQDAGTPKTMFLEYCAKNERSGAKIEIRNISRGEPSLPQKRDTKTKMKNVCV